MREFGAISRTYQNRPFSNPWAIAQGFCSKTAKFRPLRIHPKTTQKVAQKLKNNFVGVLEPFQRVWSDFQDLPKSTMFKSMGPRVFAQKRPNFDPCEFTRNRHRQCRNDLKLILKWFWSRFREFGAISRIYENRPCSKPWAIAQAFCSKTA